MVKLTKRKGFNFFRSYYDVYNELETDSDKVSFINALLDRQFLGVKPTNLKGMAKFAYISQTNSIDSQVKGYEDKTKTILTPTVGGTVGGVITPTEQVQEKEKEKEQYKEDNSINSRKLKFAHTIKEYSEIYPKEMLTDFYNYWTETNDNGKKFRREMQKTWSLKLRLSKWESNNNNFNKTQKNERLNEFTAELRNINPRA